MPNTTNRNRNTGSHSGHESVINTFARYGKRVTLQLVENYPTIFFKSAIVCFYSEEF